MKIRTLISIYENLKRDVEVSSDLLKYLESLLTNDPDNKDLRDRCIHVKKDLHHRRFLYDEFCSHDFH